MAREKVILGGKSSMTLNLKKASNWIFIHMTPV
jgi:hypothetical protein